MDDLVRLGNVPRRTSDEQLTIADLTGIAVQDIQIPKLVHTAIGKG